METFNIKNCFLQDYVKDANFIINNSVYISELNSYISIESGIGKAKEAMDGLDRVTHEITTVYLKSVSSLEKNAPRLGWFSKPKTELRDLIGSDREIGWKSPYSKNF